MVVRELDEAIAVRERQEAADEAAARNRKDRRPPPPDWTVSRGIDTHRSPVAIHIGGCHMQGKHVQAVSRMAETSVAHPNEPLALPKIGSYCRRYEVRGTAPDPAGRTRT
ncbi:hypothetical protein ACFRCX_30640 [Streptomyces sp. NPDC056652]|uniref:hypothetical protein n=1 Tax=Streptomyces sp. NPDC056652 TaxID=3345893 RepID=UPI0036BEDF97